MADQQPSHIAGGHLVVGPEGCRLIVAALELAMRGAERNGVAYRGRSRWSDVEWLHAQARLVAQGEVAVVAAENTGEAFTALLPSSDATVSAAQAAQILGITRQAVGAAIRRGDLAARREAGRYVLAETDVRQYAAGRGNGGRRVPGHVAGGPDRAAADLAGAAHPRRGDRAR